MRVASSVIMPLARQMTPSPYAKNIQIFCVSGGEGLKAQRIKDLKFTRREPFPYTAVKSLMKLE